MGKGQEVYSSAFNLYYSKLTLKWVTDPEQYIIIFICLFYLLFFHLLNIYALEEEKCFLIGYREDDVPLTKLRKSIKM